MSLIPNVILVPYGTASWSVEAFVVQSFGERATRLQAPFPFAVINLNDKQPLRLNSEAISLAPTAGAPQGASPLALFSDHLKTFCSRWDKLSLDFIDGYFDHIAVMLEQHRTALSAKLAPYAGLYAVEDWAFSSPKPLVRAHLYAPLTPGSAWSADDFVQVEFAFWLGARMIAVLSRSGTLTPAKARERQSRLEQAGVAVIALTAEDLANDQTALFNRIIGDFDALLDGAGVVPLGPFRPSILSD